MGRSGVPPVGRIIAICNQKGGVAKTTSAFHLGAAWSAVGRRVLWVDLDPQAALTGWSVGELAPPRWDAPRMPTLYHGLVGRAGAEELVLSTAAGPDLLPAGLELALAEVELVGQVAPERRLVRLLAPVRDRYDYVLLDCPPSLGLLSQNALVVADGVLIPVACEYLAVRVLSFLVRALTRVRVQANSRLAVLGMVPTLFDRRTVHGREALERLRAFAGGRFWVAPWPVVKSVRFAEAAQRGLPVWDLSPLHPGGEAYRLLAAAIDRAGPERGAPPEAEPLSAFVEGVSW